MKAKVVQKFRDKHTKEVYEPGQVLEVTKKRFEEMNSTSHGVFVEEVKEEPKKQEKKPAKK